MTWHSFNWGIREQQYPLSEQSYYTGLANKGQTISVWLNNIYNDMIGSDTQMVIHFLVGHHLWNGPKCKLFIFAGRQLIKALFEKDNPTQEELISAE